MNIQVKEENGELICKEHEKKIGYLMTGDQIPFPNALLCDECKQDKKFLWDKILDIAECRKLINDQYQLEDGQRQQYLDLIQELINQIVEYKNNVLRYTTNMVEVLSSWIQEFKPKQFIQQLQVLHKNQSLFDPQLALKKNKNDIITIQTSFQQLLGKDQLVKCKNLIQILQNYISQRSIQIQIQKPQVPQPCVPKVVNLINEIPQVNASYAFAFDSTGQILVSGCSKEIHVHKFNEGKLTDLTILLEGNKDYISGLVFSKKVKWFASSRSRIITGWKEDQNGWTDYSPKLEHKWDILCLILSNSENELISGGYDSTIIVWKLYCPRNYIKYKYQLNRHKYQVQALSLNQSETALVSCGQDKTIVLWVKIKENFEFAQQIACRGYRICFISETQFIFQQVSIGQSLIFRIENNKLLEEQRIDLKQADDEDYSFPTIYNFKRQIIIQKHNRYVYIMQKQNNGAFKVILEPIICQNEKNYGQLTDDGDYLIIGSSKQLNVYQIQY